MLTDKQHAVKPLSVMFLEYNEQGKEMFSPLISMRWSERSTCIPSTTMMYVDSKEKLQEMVSELQKEVMSGVDVEQHNCKSYLSITCLIQISTVTKDYLVDPFPLWSYLPMLNDITANIGWLL